jgi:hypothetical protein
VIPWHKGRAALWGVDSFDAALMLMSEPAHGHNHGRKKAVLIKMNGTGWESRARPHEPLGTEPYDGGEDARLRLAFPDSYDDETKQRRKRGWHIERQWSPGVGNQPGRPTKGVTDIAGARRRYAELAAMDSYPRWLIIGIMWAEEYSVGTIADAVRCHRRTVERNIKTCRKTLKGAKPNYRVSRERHPHPTPPGPSPARA